MEDHVINAEMARTLQQRAAGQSPVLWAVMTDQPDYPGKVVARLVSEQPTPYVLVADDVHSLRTRLPPGLAHAPRLPNNRHDLAEVWYVRA